jgi:hypothetical protein
MIHRIEKDVSQRMNTWLQQKEKVEDSYKKEFEKLTVRKDDLDKQLESMMEKFKERMSIFDQKKTEIEVKLSMNHLLEWNAVDQDSQDQYHPEDHEYENEPSSSKSDKSDVSRRSQHIERDRECSDSNHNGGSYHICNPFDTMTEPPVSPTPLLTDFLSSGQNSAKSFLDKTQEIIS